MLKRDELPYSITQLKQSLIHGQTYILIHFSSNKKLVQFSSVTQSCPTLGNPMDCSTPGLPVCPSPTPGVYSNSCPLSWWCHHPLILCRPLLLLPSIFPSIRIFSNESVLHIRWTKYWRFSFSISPSNKYSVLISFTMDWLNLLAVQGTLKSLLQYHSSEASVWSSAFSMIQISPMYKITRKTIALTICTFVSKVMSQLFNIQSNEVAQSCLTLCHPMDCSLPGSSVHGIFQAIVLEWIAISFSRGSS